MEKLKKSGEAILWFLSAVFLLWGWQLQGIPFLVSLCICGLIALAFYWSSEIKFEPTDLIGYCLSLGISAVVYALMAHVGFGLVTFIIIALFAIMIKVETFPIYLCNVFAVIFIFLTAFIYGYDNYVQSSENCNSKLNTIQGNSSIPTELKRQIAQNPFILFEKNNPITNGIKQKENAMQVLIHETDSMVTAMREKKLFELEKVQTKYSGKTQTLRIKRLWLNSETMPWTYSSWKQVEYNISMSGHISRGSFFRSSGGRVKLTGSAKPNIYGNSTYTGENKLDYINIVFSDNSYRRYQIKDTPEWLLAKEGQQVLLRYDKIKTYSPKDISFINVMTNASDLTLTKEYVPLFK